MLVCYKHSLKMSSINLNFAILTLIVLAISLMCLCLDLNKDCCLKKYQNSWGNSYFYIQKLTFKVMCEVYYRVKRDKKKCPLRV